MTLFHKIIPDIFHIQNVMDMNNVIMTNKHLKLISTMDVICVEATTHGMFTYAHFKMNSYEELKQFVDVINNLWHNFQSINNNCK